MAASAADVDSHDGQNAGLQTAKDLFSGAVGGIAQVLIGEFRPKKSLIMDIDKIMIYFPPNCLKIEN